MKGLMYLILLVASFSYGQDSGKCLMDIQKLEESIFRKDLGTGSEIAFVHYKVKSVVNKGAVVRSEVKLYRNAKNLNMFSPQVDIYTDENESYMVVKEQQVIIASSTPEKMMNTGFSDEFLEFKKNFMNTCTVDYCRLEDTLKGIYEAKLIVAKESKAVVSIQSMVYRYSLKDNKIIATLVNYDDDYKLKQMEIEYIAFDTDCHYSFVKPRKKILDSKGKLLAIFKGYEFIDDRNKK